MVTAGAVSSICCLLVAYDVCRVTINPMSRSRYPRMRQTDAGFSVAEMLAVLGILSILILIGAASWLGMRSRSEATAAQTSLRVIESDERLAYQDNGAFTDDVFSLMADHADLTIVPGATNSTSPTWVSVAVSTVGGYDAVGLAALANTDECYLLLVFEPDGPPSIGQSSTSSPCNAASALALTGTSTWGLNS